MNEHQEKISSVVGDYIRLFPREYKTFLEGNKEKISLNKDKFGTVTKGKVDYLERKIGEYPETLHAAFKIKFNEQDWDYFNSKQGFRWFVKHFPQFSGVEKI